MLALHGKHLMDIVHYRRLCGLRKNLAGLIAQFDFSGCHISLLPSLSIRVCHWQCPAQPEPLAYTSFSVICLSVGQTAFALVLNLTGFPSQSDHRFIHTNQSGRNQAHLTLLLLQSLAPIEPVYPLYYQIQF